ncbi:transposable element Tcb1 transposase [Trichonephila clavipes]|nr:transposable element Tcb1 transposase [Trichonephila clavipes]
MGWYWISLSPSPSTYCWFFKQLALHIQGVSQLSFLTFRAWPQPYFNRIMRDHAWFSVNHQIELLPWPAHSSDLSPIENMWSMVAHRLNQIIPPAATPDQFWQRVKAA